MINRSADEPGVGTRVRRRAQGEKNFPSRMFARPLPLMRSDEGSVLHVGLVEEEGAGVGEVGGAGVIHTC